MVLPVIGKFMHLTKWEERIMKQTTTRAFCLILGVLMLFSFAACGKNDPAPPDTASEGAGQQEASEIKSPKTISMNLWDLVYDEQDGWI